MLILHLTDKQMHDWQKQTQLKSVLGAWDCVEQMNPKPLEVKITINLEEFAGCLLRFQSLTSQARVNYY